MNSTLRSLLRSFCALSILTLAACSEPSPANSNNQTAGNANLSQSKPANSNSSQSAEQAKTGSIEVTSVPPGAGITLILDEEGGAGLPQSYGVTPTTIKNIAPGKYRIDIGANGFEYFHKEIKVTQNATVKVSATLKKQAANKRR